MKKFLKLTFAFLFVAVLLVGCGNTNNVDDEIEEDDVTDDVELFNGDIKKSWNDVSNDYDIIDTEVKNEITEDHKITKEEIQGLVTTIENKSQTLKDGITDDNEKDAKDLYRAAAKIEAIAKVDGKAVDHEIVALSRNAKALVKHYYGEAEDDFTTVSDDFKTGINKIKNYTEDEWNKFLDLFK